MSNVGNDGDLEDLPDPIFGYLNTQFKNTSGIENVVGLGSIKVSSEVQPIRSATTLQLERDPTCFREEGGSVLSVQENPLIDGVVIATRGFDILVPPEGTSPTGATLIKPSLLERRPNGDVWLNIDSDTKFVAQDMVALATTTPEEEEEGEGEESQENQVSFGFTPSSAQRSVVSTPTARCLQSAEFMQNTFELNDRTPHCIKSSHAFSGDLVFATSATSRAGGGGGEADAGSVVFATETALIIGEQGSDTRDRTMNGWISITPGTGTMENVRGVKFRESDAVTWMDPNLIITKQMTLASTFSNTLEGPTIPPSQSNSPTWLEKNRVVSKQLVISNDHDVQMPNVGASFEPFQDSLENANLLFIEDQAGPYFMMENNGLSTIFRFGDPTKPESNTILRFANTTSESTSTTPGIPIDSGPTIPSVPGPIRPGIPIGPSIPSLPDFEEMVKGTDYAELTMKDKLVMGLHSDKAPFASAMTLYRSESATSDFLHCGENGRILTIDYMADVYNQNGVYEGLSDARIKEDIQPARSQWDDIKNTRLVNFRFQKIAAPIQTTSDNNNKEEEENGEKEEEEVNPKLLGVIAQELEASGMQSLVSEEEISGVKSVKYSVLYMKALGALQELMERIETLEETLRKE